MERPHTERDRAVGGVRGVEGTARSHTASQDQQATSISNVRRRRGKRVRGMVWKRMKEECWRAAPAAWPLEARYRVLHDPDAALQRVRMVSGDGIGGSGQWLARGGQGKGGGGRGCGIQRHAAPSDKWARDPEPLLSRFEQIFDS